MKSLQYSHLLYLSTFNIFSCDNTECNLLYELFYNEIQEKIKLYRDQRPSVKEYKSDCQLLCSKYCPQVEIIPANTGARQVQDYYNIKLLMYKGATALRHNAVIVGSSAS